MVSVRLLMILALIPGVAFPAASAPAEGSEGTKVSVFAAGRSIQEVLEGLAREAGVQILMEPSVRGTLDISLQDVPFATALNAICRATGLQLEEMVSEGGRRVYLVRSRPEQTAREAARPGDGKAVPAESRAAARAAPRKDEKPQRERTVDAAKAVEFLGRASRVNLYAGELPPFQPPPTVRVGPPLTPPVYHYGYLVVPAPPYGYGGVWVVPSKVFIYRPVQPVWHNPTFFPGYTGVSVGIDAGGLKLRYTDVRPR